MRNVSYTVILIISNKFDLKSIGNRNMWNGYKFENGLRK